VAAAQTIKGEVLDMETKKPVANVRIENIYTELEISTSQQGSFIIAAAGGQLLEFKKTGYKTVRVRVPQGYIPSYFRIIMKEGISDIEPVNVAYTTRYDYKYDSIRFHELYKHELDFPQLTGLEMISHPFSALSKKNREIWQFQEDYTEFEKEKYVDRTFNEGIVTKFTGLTGDSLHHFMKRYRPSYEQLRSMNDYTFFNFVKKSVNVYRTPNEQRSTQ
jgi:hypothetical protein